MYILAHAASVASHARSDGNMAAGNENEIQGIAQRAADTDSYTIRDWMGRLVDMLPTKRPNRQKRRAGSRDWFFLVHTPPRILTD